METMRTRAKNLLPSVLLTLLSIIQALALELLWNRLNDAPWLWAGGLPALLGWTQVLAILLGILQVWLMYTSAVMRFRWTPLQQDSVLPFVIGILEFAMIDLIGPETLGPWFYVLGIVYALSVWSNQSTFRRARREPENDEFFRSVEPATARDLVPVYAYAAAIGVFGAIAQATGSQGWIAFLLMAVTAAALGYQVEQTRRFWNQSMSPADVG